MLQPCHGKEDAEHLENIQRRYLRVRMDAIIECIDVLNSCRNAHQAMELMKRHIYKYAELAYENKMQPMILLNKKRGLRHNYIKLGQSRGL